MTSAARVLRRALVAAALLGACGGESIPVGKREQRCRDVCEGTKLCGGPATIDCYTACDDLDAITRANECQDEFDALYDCIDRVGACADLDVVCHDQDVVYSDCIADPCSLDPERDVCL